MHICLVDGLRLRRVANFCF